MVEEIKAKIYSIMQEMTGSGQPFAEVYDYPVASPKLFPFAVIDIDSGNSQSDESSNLKILNFNFIVRCLFRQKNTQAASEQRLEVLDLVLAKFTANGIADYLDDTVIKMDIASIEPFAIATESDQPVFGIDFIIRTQSVMDIV